MFFLFLVQIFVLFDVFLVFGPNFWFFRGFFVFGPNFWFFNVFFLFFSSIFGFLNVFPGKVYRFLSFVVTRGQVQTQVAFILLTLLVLK